MTTDFVSLACSKDSTRFNLVKPYRDITQWVATDGHRMHIKEDFAIEKPFSLVGENVEFPNYSMVIPTKAPTASTEVNVDKTVVKDLKRLVKLAKTATGEKEICARLALDKETKVEMSIQSNKAEALTAEIRYSLDCDTWMGSPFQPTGINIEYFAEALIGMYQEIDSYLIRVKLEIHQSTTVSGKVSHGPVVLKCEKLSALIMPMRLAN